MKLPGSKPSAETKRDLARVYRVRAALEYFGATEQKEPEILPERVEMPTRNKKVWVWRNGGNGQFAETPSHIKKFGP